MMSERKNIFAYAERKYGTKPEYLWRKFPHYAVLRHKNSKKWYGIILNVPRVKLGLTGTGESDILNIKAGADLADMLRGKAGILPAYHMNKTHWLSLVLDSALPESEIFSLLDKSYALTA